METEQGAGVAASAAGADLCYVGPPCAIAESLRKPQLPRDPEHAQRHRDLRRRKKDGSRVHEEYPDIHFNQCYSMYSSLVIVTACYNDAAVFCSTSDSSLHKCSRILY